MRPRPILFSLSLLLLSTITLPASPSPFLPPSTHPPLPLPIDVIYEFPLGTWLENLAIRSNGKIDPSTTPASATLILTLPNTLGISGIAELYPDIFYFAVGNFTVPSASQLGTYSVWKLNFSVDRANDNKPVLTKITDIPGAGFLNGPSPSLRFGERLVWRLDTNTGIAKIVIADPLMAPIPSAANVGINGIKLHGNMFYFTNTDQAILARLPIHPDGTPAGKAEVLTTNKLQGDDFVLDKRGDAYVAWNPANELAFVPRGGGETVVLTGEPDSLALAEPTACQFGREEEDLLYITTTGGLVQYEYRNWTIGGRLNRVHVGRATVF
ncbi:MAG: hypothetical protein MMC33_007596 [Icmadophila ericetorum]|nr:hypothetical protein [Icmadophila ericetorum]